MASVRIIRNVTKEGTSRCNKAETEAEKEAEKEAAREAKPGKTLISEQRLEQN